MCEMRARRKRLSESVCSSQSQRHRAPTFHLLGVLDGVVDGHSVLLPPQCTWVTKPAVSSTQRWPSASSSCFVSTTSAVKMPILEKGCLCCALDTCVKVQGFILTGAFVVIAVVDLVMLSVWLIPLEQNLSPQSDDFDRRAISTTKVVCIALLFCLVLWVVLGVLLLYGVYKRCSSGSYFMWLVSIRNLGLKSGPTSSSSNSKRSDSHM
ncbi:uncharacterized protein LOC117646743 isoform X2 [Thrips palmi]|uniref:Uncharacterized protein LOC117646743 isoform X2 n=1 Tax=Thrips palmi TaxID=161013 RepID=A0A6P8Z1D6_THRPL|nr:uncharacterized protein LOC117646743 isoform X2 [Thrips palmi]